MAILHGLEPQARRWPSSVADHGGRMVFERYAAEAEAAAFEGTVDRAALRIHLEPYDAACLEGGTDDHVSSGALSRRPGTRPVDALEEAFGDELLLHLEFQRRFGASSSRHCRYCASRRRGSMEVIRSSRRWAGRCPARTAYVLDNAGWKRTDAPQPEFKAIADPFGLMNPGKLKAPAMALVDNSTRRT